MELTYAGKKQKYQRIGVPVSLKGNEKCNFSRFTLLKTNIVELRCGSEDHKI